MFLSKFWGKSELGQLLRFRRSNFDACSVWKVMWTALKWGHSWNYRSTVLWKLIQPSAQAPPRVIAVFIAPENCNFSYNPYLNSLFAKTDVNFYQIEILRLKIRKNIENNKIFSSHLSITSKIFPYMLWSIYNLKSTFLNNMSITSSKMDLSVFENKLFISILFASPYQRLNIAQEVFL